MLYLERRQQRWREFVSRHLDDSDDGSAEARGDGDDERLGKGRKVLCVLDALELWMAEQNRGCAFVNAYAELGGSEHPGVEVIRSEKEWTHDLYRRLCEEGGLSEPGQAAAALHLVHEGVLVLATAGARQHAFAQGRRAAEQLVAAARAQTS